PRDCTPPRRAHSPPPHTTLFRPIAPPATSRALPSLDRRTLMPPSPLITVLGATGTIGTDLVPRLLATGTTVRAVTRDPARRIPGAQRVIADIRDPGTLRPALARADALFLNSPSSEVAAAQQIWAADLAHELGISRLVLLSQYGARTDSPVRFLRWHGEVEQHVRSLGIDHTVLRPNLYLQSLLGLAETISRGIL